MCVVSMVYDYHTKLPDTYWTPKNYDYFLDLVEKARKYDELTGQRDCEDVSKAKLLERIKELVDRLEQVT